MDKRCTVCNAMFHTKRADAKTCSPKCRKASTRGQKDTPERVVEGSKVVGWFNSAETKTQAEIESYYTLENFPRSGGYQSIGSSSQSTSISPYPASDPRHKAYLL